MARVFEGINENVTIVQIARCKWNCLIKRRFSILLMDCVVGCICYFIFLSNDQLYDFLTESTEYFISSLKALIEWLMGNPAGLKLNKPLNTAMGRFFLYHIYLWRTYVTLLKPLARLYLSTIRVASVFGITLAFSLVVDLMVILSIHVFCFHVYASRLYQLELRALTSLWRLFRGKKFNPLRNRIDSAEYESQQLLFGTLVFTIFIFLMPTVLTYYGVFTYLRIIRHIVTEIAKFSLKYFNDDGKFNASIVFQRSKLLARAIIYGNIDLGSD